jgi:hypothetical protein
MPPKGPKFDIGNGAKALPATITEITVTAPTVKADETVPTPPKTTDILPPMFEIPKERITEYVAPTPAEILTQFTKEEGKGKAAVSSGKVPTKAAGGTSKPVLTLKDIAIEDFEEDLDFAELEFEAYPEFDEWDTDDLCNTEVDTNYTVNQMLQDMNGTRGFSEDKAAIGTVPELLFLQVTHGMTIPTNFVVNSNPFLDNHTAITSVEYQRRVVLFIYANQVALVEANVGLSPEFATFIAYLRANIVIAGGVALSLPARAIYVDEYHVSPLTYDDVQLDHIRLGKDTVRYIASYWLQYVALLRHIFITRGHHYKDEYTEFIERTWRATTIEAPQGVTVPPWQHILRTALHCFGIRALHILTRHGYQQGLISKSFDKRYFAAPAGTAPIRTGWAALKNMMKATWWPKFHEMFKEQVENLRQADENVRKIGLRAHVNARLFNWSWTSVEINMDAIEPLAPWILGFLDTLPSGESIKRQQAINKRGDGGSAIRAMFARVIQNDAMNAGFMSNMEDFFASQVKPVQKGPKT